MVWERGGWDGPAPISGDFPGHQAFLHAGLEETPSRIKSPESSAVTASSRGRRGALGTAGPLGQQGLDGRLEVEGQKAAAVRVRGTLSRPTRSFWKFQGTSLRHAGDQARSSGSVTRAGASALGVRSASRRRRASAPARRSPCPWPGA